MNDPLTNFDWASLCKLYDARCAGFDHQSEHLVRFTQNRPESDRLLYYQLIEYYSLENRTNDSDPVSLYKAMLYWKLYSQRTTDYMFSTKWASGDGFERAQTELPRLLKSLPTTLDRNVEAVISAVKALGEFKLPGMGNGTIPVRTTFLHFLFPSSVPIVDIMVLRAVGEGKSHRTNKKCEKINEKVLSEYLPIVWSLTDKHAFKATDGHSETPLRLIDMALWITRGSKGKLTRSKSGTV